MAGGLSYSIGYNKAVEQGYYIANTQLMGQLWGVTSKSGVETGSFTESLGNTIRIENSGKIMLQQITMKQNEAIHLWFQALKKIGIIEPTVIDGATVKKYYDIIRSLGGINTLGMTQAKEEQQLVNAIIRAKNRFNIPIMIRDELLSRVDNGLITFRANGTLHISTSVIEEVVDSVYNKMANDILNSNEIFNSNQIDNIKQQIINVLQQQLQLSGILKQITQKNKNSFKLKKNNARSIIRGKGKGLTGLLLENNELQDFNVAEYVAAAIGAALGAKTRATGQDLTRVIRILDSTTGDFTNQLVSGKDDAIWDYIDFAPQLDNLKIRIHISTKLYGIRSTKGGKAESSGLSVVNLEGSGKAIYRYQELEKLLSQSTDKKTYQRIVFGINNLAKDSLLEGSAHIKKYENILAMFFAAFMFNSSMDELTNNFSAGNDTYNIYLFNLNGEYYTLSEICERLLILTARRPDTFSSYIRTTISPAPSYVADWASGQMFIGGQIKNPVFTQNQWNAVRTEIENATVFSTTTLNAKKLLQLAGVPS